MYPLLVAALMACPADYTHPVGPVPDAYQDPGLDQAGAGAVIDLASRPAELSLAVADPASAFASEYEIEVRATGAGWRGTLPFDPGGPDKKPPPLVVTVDGAPIPHSATGTGWSLKRRDLVLRVPEEPQRVVVAWPELYAALGRRSPERSGLAPEQFVRWSMTHAGETRHGLLLPAPSSATWEIALPGGAATFETWTAIDDAPERSLRSGGATAIVEVVDGDRTTEVGRARLTAGSGYSRLRADLGRWAGRTVQLRLRSDPGGDPAYDDVFFGSPQVWGPPTGDVRRIVVIGIDTLRPDHLGLHGYSRDTSPELDAIAADAVVFDRAWTPAPRTRPSFRTATTGRYPLDAIGAKNLSELFRERGFATAGVVANVHLQPRFGFDRGFDTWAFDNGARANQQVDRALEFLRLYPDRDTYLFLHVLDPHLFYDPPYAYDRFTRKRTDLPIQVNRWEVYARMDRGEISDDDKAYLEDRYDGEIAFTSHELGRFFNALDQMPGRTLVVIHSDHGEEFWEHGGYEHNHTLYQETTRGLLIVRPGKGFRGGRRVDVPVTLADIAPTVLDFAGIPAADRPPLDGKSLRPLVEGEAPGDDWRRPIGLGHIRYGWERWGVVADGHKYVLHTGTGQEELYDLTADPGEQTDLAATADLRPYRNALSEAHGMPVCPGWRIGLDSRPGGTPVTLALPEPPMGVVLVDPERTVDNPANQAWGEPPTRTIDEIGEVAWEPGSDRLTWTPGRAPHGGLLFVFWDHEVSPSLARGVLPGALVPTDLTRLPNGTARFSQFGAVVTVGSGPVILPPMGEAAVMQLQAASGGEADASSLAMLRELGYIHDDGDGAVADDDPLSPSGSPATMRSEVERAEPGAATVRACRW